MEIHTGRNRGARDALLGQVLQSRYRIEEPLGSGTTGTVYRATHLALERACAVKILHRTASADQNLVARFRREARAASRLDHPNIVYLSDFGRLEDGPLFLVMEYVEGPSLKQALAGGQLTRQRVLAVLRQLALALDAAHEEGVIHRDIKPDNIGIGETPGKKLTLVTPQEDIPAGASIS